MLLDRKLPLKLKTVPTTINRHEVYEMQRMAQEDFGVDFKFDTLVNPRTDCSQSPLAIRLTPEDAVALDFHEPRRYARVPKTGRQRTGVTRQQLDRENVYNCGGGVTSCAIDPYGQITICVLSHQESYDWRSGSFGQGWDDFLVRVRGRKKTRADQVRFLPDPLPVRLVRGDLPNLENGDAESPVEFMCEVAHLRAMALDVVVPAHGECECCAGGSSHAKLAQSAERIRKGEVNVGSWTPARAQYITAGPAASVRLWQRVRFLRRQMHEE